MIDSRGTLSQKPIFSDIPCEILEKSAVDMKTFSK